MILKSNFEINLLDRRFLIFSNYIGCLDAMQNLLEALGITFGRLDGKMSADEKAIALSRMFLLSIL
jgi:SNF2 family DNA or RNA helicase